MNEYEIVSVERSDPPADMIGTGWYCYVIQQGNNTIRGYRRGNLQSVRNSLEETVERLNERRYGRRGRVHLTMTSRRKKTPDK